MSSPPVGASFFHAGILVDKDGVTEGAQGMEFADHPVIQTYNFNLQQPIDQSECVVVCTPRAASSTSNLTAQVTMPSTTKVTVTCCINGAPGGFDFWLAIFRINVGPSV